MKRLNECKACPKNKETLSKIVLCQRDGYTIAVPIHDALEKPYISCLDESEDVQLELF